MPALRHTAIALARLAGRTNIAAACRHYTALLRIPLTPLAIYAEI